MDLFVDLLDPNVAFLLGQDLFVILSHVFSHMYRLSVDTLSQECLCGPHPFDACTTGSASSGEGRSGDRKVLTWDDHGDNGGFTTKKRPSSHPPRALLMDPRQGLWGGGYLLVTP